METPSPHLKIKVEKGVVIMNFNSVGEMELSPWLVYVVSFFWLSVVFLYNYFGKKRKKKEKNRIENHHMHTCT